MPLFYTINFYNVCKLSPIFNFITMTHFSGALQISDLDDFIAPSQVGIRHFILAHIILLFTYSGNYV